MAVVLDGSKFVGTLKTSFCLKASVRFDSDFWMVDETFYFHMPDQTTVVVPKGYLTDGASVPRFLWAFIPPWGAYGQAAVLHDYLCEYLTICNGNNSVPITRQECDAILNHAMKLVGVPKILRMMIYAGVSLYRIACRVRDPNPNPAKQALELELIQEDSGDAS